MIGGYQGRGSTCGYGVKRKREIMIVYLKDKRPETAIKRIYSSMERTNKHIQ